MEKKVQIVVSILCFGVIGLFFFDGAWQHGALIDAEKVFNTNAQSASQSLRVYADEQHSIKTSSVSDIEKLDKLLVAVSTSKDQVSAAQVRTESFSLPSIFYEKNRYQRRLERLKESYAPNYERVIAYLDFLTLQYTASKNLEIAYGDKKVSADELRSYASEIQEATRVLQMPELGSYYSSSVGAIQDSMKANIEAADAMALRPNAPYDYEKLMNLNRGYIKDSESARTYFRDVANSLE